MFKYTIHIFIYFVFSIHLVKRVFKSCLALFNFFRALLLYMYAALELFNALRNGFKTVNDGFEMRTNEKSVCHVDKVVDC